jgi:hypothetical protein
MATRFIRKNGRIIPLRERQAADRREGAALVATGGAIAAGAGVMSARAFEGAKKDLWKAKGFRMRARNAYTKAQKSMSMRPRLNRQAAQFVNQAAQKIGNAVVGQKAAINYQGVGKVLGGGLIGAGIHKLLPEKVKKHPVADYSISIGSGAAATYAINTAYRRTVNSKSLISSIMKAAKRAR